jgi:hypothetical protein
MNDRWSRQDGKRWSRRERDRVAERFRSHVRTPSNPGGRIHRERCPWHPEKERSEAHHPDYSKPFLVVWCCFGCHRKIDHGSLVPTKTHIWDYTSLIASVERPGLFGNRNAVRDAVEPTEFEEHESAGAEVPF